MAWKLDSDRPIYNQIVERVTLAIISGQYQPGEKLPSVRELAAEAAVNPNTMQKAMAELERTGLVASMRTSGRFITEDTALIRQEKERLAEVHISEFLQSMRNMGMDEQEIMELIQKNLHTSSAPAVEA